ncbi:MAG: AtpZ/AtpI family protein [Myxococcota bacterium]|jgi:F0F1-type ATP synthase assembly protein I|nr:AtpZ/AtpI family protein [Myxococcota bacterium]
MTHRDPNTKRETRELVQQVSRYATVGLEMGLSVALCVVAGRYLDNRLNTAPWFVLAGIGLGLATAGRCLYRAAKRASKEFD